MPIALLVLLVLSFISSRIHLPLMNNLPIMGGILLMGVDLIIQIVRLSLKKTHYSTLLGSVTLVFLSIGYAFTWRLWPGAIVYAWTALVIAFVYIVYWVVTNRRVTARFCTALVIFMALLAFNWMPRSTFFCFKLDINPNHPKAPVATLHKLAWFYNIEGKTSSAYMLLEKSYDHVTEKLVEIRKKGRDTHYERIFEQDSAILSNDIARLTNAQWTDFKPLDPDDYP